MKSLTLKPTGLSGRIQIPPSKSMAHRAIICAFLSEGESRIGNVELSNDIIATCRAIEALGADIDILEGGFPDVKHWSFGAGKGCGNKQSYSLR